MEVCLLEGTKKKRRRADVEQQGTKKRNNSVRWGEERIGDRGVVIIRTRIQI